MEKQSFDKLLADSEEQFRKQFDPNSICYHNGLPIAVPLNGQRVPESMPTMYPQNYDPNQSESFVDYGQEYKVVQSERTVHLNLKKSLSKLGPIMEAFLRHQQIFNQKGNPQNQKHQKAFEDNIAKEKENLIEAQKELESYLPLLGTFEDQKEIAEELSQIIQLSQKKYSNKEELAQFNFKIKKVSAKVFSNSQKCLQRLKNIKKVKIQESKQNQKQP